MDAEHATSVPENFAIASPTVLLANKKCITEAAEVTPLHLSAHSPRPALGALSESPLTPRSGVSEDAVRAWSEGEWCEKETPAPGTF